MSRGPRATSWNNRWILLEVAVSLVASARAQVAASQTSQTQLSQCTDIDVSNSTLKQGYSAFGGSGFCCVRSGTKMVCPTASDTVDGKYSLEEDDYLLQNDCTKCTDEGNCGTSLVLENVESTGSAVGHAPRTPLSVANP